MSYEQELERIFSKLDDLSAGQGKLSAKLGVIGERLGAHIEGSVKYRDRVDEHEQSIQRLRGAGWLLGTLWGLLVTIVGFLWRSHGAK